MLYSKLREMFVYKKSDQMCVCKGGDICKKKCIKELWEREGGHMEKA